MIRNCRLGLWFRRTGRFLRVVAAELSNAPVEGQMSVDSMMMTWRPSSTGRELCAVAVCWRKQGSLDTWWAMKQP